VKLATVGRECGHQVRIKRNDSDYGLYTVSQVRQESPDNIVRMGSTGRKRLGTSDEFVGSLDSRVPHPSFDDADAETNNEFVERRRFMDGRRAGALKRPNATHSAQERFSGQRAIHEGPGAI
jgi:hypothetical protein